MNSIFIIIIGSVLVNNYVMVQFLGICPFLGVSKKLGTAVGMGLAVTFVMGISSMITWLIQRYILEAFELEYLQTIVFILIIAVLVQFVEMVIKKNSPSLYNALGVYLPLITTNCAVLGSAIINITNNYTLIESVVNGISSALGFMLALVLFAGIRERLESSDIPEALKGMPSTLIAAGLMSIVFLGFRGLI